MKTWNGIERIMTYFIWQDFKLPLQMLNREREREATAVLFQKQRILIQKHIKILQIAKKI